jgi:helicase required for RNAi-mediated heterochromatin assembly 1
VGGVDQNPPQVDIFWGNYKEAVFDPDERKKTPLPTEKRADVSGEYIMVEARTGYFEASRHMLVAIQKLMNER